MISPSKWSTAGGDSQQRLTFIFKGNLTAGAPSTSATSCHTTAHPMLAVPGGPPRGTAKTVPIKVLALPSGTSGLTLKSSLAELISPSGQSSSGPRSSAASGSVSPPIRLVVSKMASVKAASLSSPASGSGAKRALSPSVTPSPSASLVNMVMKSVMVAGATTSLKVRSPVPSIEAPSPVVQSSTASSPDMLSSARVPVLGLPEQQQPVVSGACEMLVGTPPVTPDDSREAMCAMVAAPSVVVTEADTHGASSSSVGVVVSATDNKGGECSVDDACPVEERLALPASCLDIAESGEDELVVLSPTVIANHVGSPQLPDSLSTLLDMAIDPPDDDDDSEPPSGQASPAAPVSLVLANHKDSEEEEAAVGEHDVDLELLRTCPEASVCAPGDELEDPDGLLRNQRRRAAQVPSPAVVAEAGESEHSSEEEMSLSELAHKSRVRQPRLPPLPRQGKENEVLVVTTADSPAPTTRREDGGPGRPRRLTAAVAGGESKAVRSRLGQQQMQGGQQQQHQQPQALANQSPVAIMASLPTERGSRRSPATMPSGRDHRASPPRLPNQRNFRRDSEVRDEDAVVVMKRKTRASGPSTDPQQEAAAPNKRRRYSKDSHR